MAEKWTKTHARFQSETSKTTMSDQRRGRHSIFGGLVLVLIGTLFLIQNFYPVFELWNAFLRWWPLLLILLGVARLIDYLLEHRAPDAPAPRVASGGDIFLIVAVVALVALVAGVHKVGQRLERRGFLGRELGQSVRVHRTGFLHAAIAGKRAHRCLGCARRYFGSRRGPEGRFR
jgi:hypothetical protein